MTEQAEIETRAKEMGWSPKEEFRGDPEKWVEAKEYIERGETLMPLLKANNRKLNDQVSELTRKLTSAQEALAASQESIEALKDHNSEANRKAMKDSIAVTRGKLIEAKKEDNPEAEVALEEQLASEQAALREAEKSSKKEEKKPNGNAEEDYTKAPEWQAWAKDNAWYGTDRRRTALAMGIADEIRNDPATKDLRGREFLDKVTEEVERVFNPQGKPAPRVEGKGRGSGGGGGGEEKKTYADLPQDAKDACERNAPRLVGKGHAYKTNEEWRAKYTEDYFAQEQS